jgi:hypothetical protein
LLQFPYAPFSVSRHLPAGPGMGIWPYIWGDFSNGTDRKRLDFQKKRLEPGPKPTKRQYPGQ